MKVRNPRRKFSILTCRQSFYFAFIFSVLIVVLFYAPFKLLDELFGTVFSELDVLILHAASIVYVIDSLRSRFSNFCYTLHN